LNLIQPLNELGERIVPKQEIENIFNELGLDEKLKKALIKEIK
jgi:hypothetical protein